jgi:cation transport ATPase
MPRQTVWLRSEPMGSRTLLPSRDEYRARNAKRSLRAGIAGLIALAAGLALSALDARYPTWAACFVLALVLGAAGIASAAVALRARSARHSALMGLAASGAAFLGSLIGPALIG